MSARSVRLAAIRHKETRELAAAAVAAGWTVERTSGGHVRFRPADRSRTLVVCASTPGDCRAVRILRAYLRRSGLAC